MTRRSAKSLLTWLFAIGLGAMSFLGDGLHDLLGLHHHESVLAVRGSDVYGVSQGDSRENGHSRFVAADNHREDYHDSTTCPICQYLAQASVIGQRFQVTSVPVSMPNRSLAAPLVIPAADLQPFQARAPPAA